MNEISKMSNSELILKVEVRIRYLVNNEFENTASYFTELLRRFKEQDRWIAVTERLPEMGEYISVYTSERAILKGRLCSNGWSVIFSDGERLVTGEVQAVTHWRPLPNPPSN